MIILFLAMTAYLGYYVWHSLRDGLQTSPAVLTTVTESAEARGFLVRRELLITTSRPYVYLEAGDGTRVSAGQTVALGTDDADGLARAARIRELQTDIARKETLLSDMRSSTDLARRDAAIRSAIFDMNSAAGSGEYAEVDGALASLSALALSGGASSVTREDLDADRAELSGLLQSAQAGSEEITAPDAGLFTGLTDGYEALSPDMLWGLTPSGVDALAGEKAEASPSVIGKLVTGCRWYFASVMDAASAGRLTEDSYAKLDFGVRCGGSIRARVEYISVSESGRCAVVFSSTDALEATLATRQADAGVVFGEFTGLRVPLKALRVDSDGATYVYVLSASRVVRADVDILTKTDDYYLAAAAKGEDDIHEGSSIIVSGKDIKEGEYIE